MSPSAIGGWQQIARAKQDERSLAIDKGIEAAGPSSSLDDAYLAATACQIVERIQNGDWTAGAVVRAFIRRAAMVHSRFNCLTEVRFCEAILEADALDASSKEHRGRLHGVPLTLKDSFFVAGYDSSNGYSSCTNKPAQQDGELVSLLKAEGAIVIAKTNIPQTLLFFETSNPVFGRTTNPWNPEHTCGGSSGGEAVVLATDASAVGLGTDIGGSVRIPAFYCGIYALKPSAGRISNLGRAASCPGQESIPAVVGPMGRSVNDVELLTRVVLGRAAASWDRTAPVLYRDVHLGRLRFGYYTFDGCFKASPANERAVLETVAALRTAGHEVVQFEPPNVLRAVELFVGLTSSDGYSTILGPIGSDPQEPQLSLITLGPRIPGVVRSIALWLIATFIGDAQFYASASSSKSKTVAEVYRLNTARDEYTKQWYTEVWDQQGFDGIIAPSQSIPAPRNGKTSAIPLIGISTFLYNITDMPVGVVPVTRVDNVKDALTAEWLAAGPRGGKIMERRLFYADTPIYDAVQMHGLPVGVQIVGRRWEDEKVVAMMRVVDDALGGRGFGPGSWTP